MITSINIEIGGRLFKRYFILSTIADNIIKKEDVIIHTGNARKREIRIIKIKTVVTLHYIIIVNYAFVMIGI